MSFTHSNVKIGKDEKGVFFLIPFTENNIEKVYADEIFEENIDSGELLDITISPHMNVPPSSGFFHTLNEDEIKNVTTKLDLRPIYHELRPDLNIHTYLTNIYKNNPPKLAFKAETIAQHKEWREIAKEKVIELTGYNLGDSLGKIPTDIEEGEEIEFQDLILKKIYFTTAPYLKTVGILAYKKELNGKGIENGNESENESGNEKRPGIICVHGHNSGKICTTGFHHSSSDSYYGIELAKRGFVTFSLDQWGWGERSGKYQRIISGAEAKFSLSALLLELTAIGIRAWDVSRSIDFLKSLDFVGDKFGVIGQSGGGTTAAFSSVMDERIDAAVVSGYYCNWFDSIFSLSHCACNYIPGMLKYMDIDDIMAIRAPKPTFIVSGENDPIFPQKGVQSAYKKLKKAYDLYNLPENLQIDVLKKTGHKFRGDFAYPWLEKVLGI